MNHIEIYYKQDKFDVISKAKLKDIKAAGYDTNFTFKTEHMYKVNADLSSQELDLIAKEILLDPVIQGYEVDSYDTDARYEGFYIADIWLKNGVTDPVGETIERGIKTIGINHKGDVHTGFRYLISKDMDKDIAEEIVSRLLMNSVIQEYRLR